ncbi:LysM peptidoglycan-binding domain-containing protein [Pelobium manganitolerans]|uniref:LysM peptidoglycan-binding domain-containing protein n=1 Tax=Pelobium manganitolerans TaxID=1842495 RepID=UPI003FA38537
MKTITIETGQNIIDIAEQEYGTLEAVYHVCNDNNLPYDALLYAGQKLVIREFGVDDILFINVAVLNEFKRKEKDGLPFLVNSRTPMAELPPAETVDLPSFYGAGAVGLNAEGILGLTQIFRQSQAADDLPFVADMERLFYATPSVFGHVAHAYQLGGYDARTSFDELMMNLIINGEVQPYYVLRLKHDTYLTEADNFKITFR